MREWHHNMNGAGEGTTTTTALVEIDKELMEAIDTRAQHHGLSFDAALQKCLVFGVNYAVLEECEKIN